MTGDVLNNFDWSGYLKTWSGQLARCTSEEDLYQKLQEFKYEFNSAYGKLSRKERKSDGFRYKEE